MIELYMNQSLTWKHSVSVNEYNESTFSTSTIKGRKETGHKIVRDKHGEEVVSSARVFTQSLVVCDDFIDDELVLSVESGIDLDGSVGYYTVYLK